MTGESTMAAVRTHMGHINSILMAVSRFPGKLYGITLAAGAPAIAPGFTLDLMAEHSLDFWLTSEDLPDPNNRVTLDRDGAIVLSYQPSNEKGHHRLAAKLKDLMKQQRWCSEHGHGRHVGNPALTIAANALRVGDHLLDRLGARAGG